MAYVGCWYFGFCFFHLEFCLQYIRVAMCTSSVLLPHFAYLLLQWWKPRMLLIPYHQRWSFRVHVGLTENFFTVYIHKSRIAGSWDVQIAWLNGAARFLFREITPDCNIISGTVSYRSCSFVSSLALDIVSSFLIFTK